jgi:hypothetical protein
MGFGLAPRAFVEPASEIAQPTRVRLSNSSSNVPALRLIVTPLARAATCATSSLRVTSFRVSFRANPR